MANVKLNFQSISQQKKFSITWLTNLLKYLLIGANCVIILDAIFLLISEKDSYQGEFIAGRHPVSRYLVLMLYVDIQSILMILIAVFGIIGVRKKNYAIVTIYALIIAVVAAFSVNDLDAFVMEVLIAIWSIVYAIGLKKCSDTASGGGVDSPNIPYKDMNKDVDYVERV